MPSTIDYDSYYYRASTLDMGTGTPSNSRSPLALLSKFKKQATALVKSSASTPNESPTRSGANEKSLMGAKGPFRHTVASPDRTHTVSFAPTPVPSVFTPSRPSTSSSFALSRTSTSDANSSFLECEEPRSFKVSPRRLKNTLFRNRNTHLNASRSEQDLELNSSQVSVATGDTQSTTTDEAFSTESSDCIPYIPFVSQHERGVFPEPSSAPQTRYTQRQAASSPTPSCSTAESNSTHSAPHTPRNLLFGGDSDSQPSITISSEEQEGDEVSITSSSVSYASTERDTFGLPVTSTNLKGKESMVSFSDPFGTERARRAREVPRHPFAASPDPDDVFTEQRAPATGAEADIYSIATSASCYSLDTYHDPADEDYRFSRTSSQMNVQLDPSHPTVSHLGNRTSTATANSDGQLMLDDYTKMRFSAATGSHMSAPPDIRVESASTISHIPTPRTETFGHIAHLDAHDQLRPQTQSQSSPRYRPVHVPSFGMGRQTVDPRTIQNEASTGKMAKEKEWTLFLGDKEEEDSFVRVRKASQSVGAGSLGRKAGKAVQAASVQMGEGRERGSLEERGSEREADVLRQRTKSAGPRLLTSPEETMDEMKRRLKAELKAEVEGVTLPPFATESPVGKPLLRVKSMVDLDEEVDDAPKEDEPTIDIVEESTTTYTMKEKERALRRSGSAHPILDGNKEHNRLSSSGDDVDWTLMLPLPMPRKSRNMKAANAVVSRADSAKAPPPKLKIVKKAVSSYDLGSPVVHFRTRKVSSPLTPNFNRRDKDLKKADAVLAKVSSASAAVQEAGRILEQRREHRSDLSAEDMLAAILDLESISSEGKPEINKEDHRQKALDMLSGASPVEPKYKATLGELLDLSPAVTMTEFGYSSSSEGVIDMEGDQEVARSTSPSDSVRFEQHLASLMDGIASETEDEEGDTAGVGAAVARGTLHSQPSRTSQAAPEAPLPDVPSPQWERRASTSPRSPTFPGSPTCSTSPVHRPSRSSLISVKSITPNLARSPNLSTRAPIGVRRDSSQFGRSFSQYGAGSTQVPFPGTTSSTSKPASPTLLEVQKSMSFSASRPSTAPSRLLSNQDAPTKPIRPPPIVIPTKLTQQVVIEDDAAASSRSRMDSGASLSSVCSVSSTDTVVPSGRNLAADIMALSSPGTTLSVSQPNSAIEPPSPANVEEFDFPLPPASLPLTGVVPSGSREDTRSSLSNLGFLQRRPVSGERMLERSTPVFGADEDNEIPPPTPISAKGSPKTSPHRSPPSSLHSHYTSSARSSPMASPQPTPPSSVYHERRASPTPQPTSQRFYSGHPFASPTSGASSSSQWMDEEDDDEAQDEEEFYYRYGMPTGKSLSGTESDESGETDYEDAVSMFGVSEEDYEDAVSMLSGMFYSARTSFDG